MRRTYTMMVMTLAAIMTQTLHAEQVEVAGSAIKYDSEITTKVGDKEVTMVATGAALRERFFVNVYAIASYVHKGATIKSADELAEADIPKQLHLILERDIEGEKMASAVNDSITANYSPDEFKEELKAFLDFIKADDIAKGDEVRITHVPGKGIDCVILGKKPRAIQIHNVKFSRAVWDIYFGKRNLGPSIKRGLVSRL